MFKFRSIRPLEVQRKVKSYRDLFGAPPAVSVRGTLLNSEGEEVTLSQFVEVKYLFRDWLVIKKDDQNVQLRSTEGTEFLIERKKDDGQAS